MRFVIKGNIDPNLRLAEPETRTELIEIITTANKGLITDAIYREPYDTPDGKRSRVEDNLAIYYLNKCGYCERICKADIEHYRPKKGIADVPGHPGYYWLCYEWSNLIPSCITCNRDGAKHNRFPVLGPRINTPPLHADGTPDFDTMLASNSPLVDEQPFLLHPEIDVPETFFKFEIDPNGEGIRIQGIDPNHRGERTIEICKLNRKELKIDRVERVIDDFKEGIQCLFIKYERGDIDAAHLADRITEHIQILKSRSLIEDKTHTLLRKYIVRSTDNFTQIVIPFFDHGIGLIVAAAFHSRET